MKESTSSEGWPRRSAGIANGGSPILVMDDDQFIQMLATGMLEHLGFPSLACSDGQQAIDLYQGALEGGNPFMAAIMDLEIPGGMGGKEAASRILAIDPGARLVVSSGNRYDPVVKCYQNFGFCYCMPKPYGLAELTKMLSHVAPRR
jgi:two-component system, cell cycle sensor histidine kinase and response regulator CckA